MTAAAAHEGDGGHGYGDVAVLRRLAQQARPHRRYIGGLLGLSLLKTPLALLAPVPLKIVVDSVLGTQPAPGFLTVFGNPSTEVLLGLVALFFVVVALLTELQNLSMAVLSAYTGERLLLGFRTRMFSHIQRLSLRYHDERGTADAVYRIQYDATSIQWVAVFGFAPLLTSGFTLIGMIAITASIDWELAAVALGITPILFLLTRATRASLRKRWAEAKAFESAGMSVVQEVLTSLRVVKAFVQEDRETDRFVGKFTQGMQARVRLALVQGAFSLLVGLTAALGTATVLYVGAKHVQSGQLTLGELLLVMGYLTQLYGPLEELSKSVTTLQQSFASAERAFRILDQEPDVPERPDARPLERARGAIEFRDVAFTYGGDEPVLRDVSFSVPAGARVGIAGRTGAGKTTLISLLTRFYDPTEGAILLDGVDLRDYRVADLRSQYAIVLQEPVLFSTTIGENIAYGRPSGDATPEEVVAAARAANAHDFIAELPEGYDTPVGERGMRLSGGERQRISLARAFLKDAPVLVLDEPTSSVDVKTEAAIMDAMERLMAGRTTFLISHRLGTLAGCDMQLQVEGGGVVPVERTRAAAPPAGRFGGAAVLAPPVTLPHTAAGRRSPWQRWNAGRMHDEGTA